MGEDWVTARKGPNDRPRRLVDKLWAYREIVEDLTAALAEFEAVAAALEAGAEASAND